MTVARGRRTRVLSRDGAESRPSHPGSPVRSQGGVEGLPEERAMYDSDRVSRSRVMSQGEAVTLSRHVTASHQSSPSRLGSGGRGCREAIRISLPAAGFAGGRQLVGRDGQSLWISAGLGAPGRVWQVRECNYEFWGNG